jgi:hypothetical protein
MSTDPSGAPKPYTPRSKRGGRRPAMPGPAIPKMPKPGAANPGRKLFGTAAAAKFKSRKGA